MPPLRNILVVEDDFAIAYDVEHALIESGVNVVDIRSASGFDLDVLQEVQPDLALINFRKSRSSAILKAVEILRKLEIPVVVLSTHVDQARAVLDDLTAVYVQQPLTPRKLERMFEGTLS